MFGGKSTKLKNQATIEALVSDDNNIKNAKAGRKNVFCTREEEEGNKKGKQCYLCDEKQKFCLAECTFVEDVITKPVNFFFPTRKSPQRHSERSDNEPTPLKTSNNICKSSRAIVTPPAYCYK